MSYLWTPEQIRGHYPTPYSLPFRHMTALATFATTEEFSRSVLPPCLEPAPDPTLSVSAMAFMDWRNGVPSVAQRDRAAMVGINAVHDGEEGLYCLTVIETEEINIEKGRELWGMPKKLGAVDLFDDGKDLYAFVDRKHHRLVELRGTLGAAEQVDPAETHHAVYFELRGYLAPTGMSMSNPQLVITDIETNLHRSQPLVDVDLTLFESPFDPGVATIPVGAFRDGVNVAGVDNYKIREVVELEGDGHDYAPYVLGRFYSA
ncbi:MAG TPA: acetoacetate decarboxylase family protein [Baekduia sp.]|uniref:acetoacetate decarboxylase family protein n=1 Tax=Baekduia sp. TaxID=2600305 RepID=UPI002D7A26D0|nr:acetoacetate decarboxylase family protein [Baekduia sp.]HET6509102.1 acetoacetate decarboxylase family protein [Baekduia sp.]